MSRGIDIGTRKNLKVTTNARKKKRRNMGRFFCVLIRTPNLPKKREKDLAMMEKAK
jgi:hypothetical protein